MTENTEFALHPQLENDCHILGNTELNMILLHKNASVPWIILVPLVRAKELHQLEQDLYRNVMEEARQISVFAANFFDVERLNIASLGNVVDQLHIHIIGRSSKDSVWPDVIWGNLEEDACYSEEEIATITAGMGEAFV